MSTGSTLQRRKLKSMDKFDAPHSSLLVVTDTVDEHTFNRKIRRGLLKVRQRLFRKILKSVQRGQQ